MEKLGRCFVVLPGVFRDDPWIKVRNLKAVYRTLHLLTCDTRSGFTPSPGEKGGKRPAHKSGSSSSYFMVLAYIPYIQSSQIWTFDSAPLPNRVNSKFENTGVWQGYDQVNPTLPNEEPADFRREQWAMERNVRPRRLCEYNHAEKVWLSAMPLIVA